MNDDEFDISVIIPAKDEELRLPQFLQSLIAYCKKSTLHYEIIVVDDGSSDSTAQKTLELQALFPTLRLLSLGQNYGKGYAVKQGLLSSHGRIALFMDADGSTPANEIEKNLKFLKEGYDIVIGSRVLQDESSKVIATTHRKGIGFVFKFLVSTFLIKDIRDTQCGFKMFRHEIIRPLWDNIKIHDFGFDLEVLFLAQRMNYKIKEVPVNWKHVGNSKVNLIKDSWRMLVNIFQIRNWYKI